LERNTKKPVPKEEYDGLIKKNRRGESGILIEPETGNGIVVWGALPGTNFKDQYCFLGKVGGAAR